MVKVVVAVLCGAVLVGCLDPTTGRPPGVNEPVAQYRSSVSTVSAADLGSSWRQGCPVGPSELRQVRVDYWGYDGLIHQGNLIVHRDVADDVAAAFGGLYWSRFQIRRIHPVSRYGSSDDASMAANNTSAFNCRRTTGGTKWSEHAYGRALDINPVQNPYVGTGSAVLPEAAKPWANRKLVVPGMVHPNGPAVKAFASIGWRWGGSWSSPKDYQHFSANGR